MTHVAPARGGQGELLGDDYAQPDAANGGPLFCSDGQSRPTDNFLQADPQN